MDRYFRIKNINLIYFGILLFLNSCAQLGDISGGTKDNVAPKLISVFPPNESLNFNSKNIIFKFDEYIKLNNPLENIVISPKGIKVNAKVDKKKVILDFEGDFEKNTTYHITFNSAIQDITEGNDSLTHYVLSTGDKLDTLKYSGIIADAYTGEKSKNILLGLYSTLDTITSSKPIYFTKTNEFGRFEISYLKQGKYKVYAFDDVNKDMTFQLTEKAGFRDSLLEITESVYDSLSILLSNNILPKKITSKAYIYPRLLKIAANYSLEETDFLFNDQAIEKASIFYYSTDSISLLLPNKPTGDFYVIAKRDNKKDTLNFKASINQNNVPFSEIHPSNKNISKRKSFMILFADEIASIDSSKISCLGLDSSSIFGLINYDKNTFDYKIPDTISSNISITFEQNSIVFLDSNLREKISYNLINKPDREFGSLIFKTISIPTNSFVEFIFGGKVILRRSESSLQDDPTITHLEPGEYSFRIVIDKDQNSKWNPGSVIEGKQAEKVLHFPEKVKIRANWETEIIFEVDL